MKFTRRKRPAKYVPFYLTPSTDNQYSLPTSQPVGGVSSFLRDLFRFGYRNDWLIGKEAAFAPMIQADSRH